MKRIIALFLTLLMLFSFAACSEYEGGAKYALKLSGQEEVYALSNVLKKNQIPTKIRYSVQNKSYDITKYQGTGNDKVNYLVKPCIFSLSELAKFEESKLLVYEFKTYSDAQPARHYKEEEIRYYFSNLDFDELEEIVETYVSKYYPNKKESLTVKKGVKCEFSYEFSYKDAFSIRITGPDINNQFFISVRLTTEIDQ